MDRISVWKIRALLQICHLCDVRFRDHKHVHINSYFQQKFVEFLMSVSGSQLVLSNCISLPWGLLDKHLIKPYTRPSKSEAQWLGADNLCFDTPLGASDGH